MRMRNRGCAILRTFQVASLLSLNSFPLQMSSSSSAPPTSSTSSPVTKATVSASSNPATTTPTTSALSSAAAASSNLSTTTARIEQLDAIEQDVVNVLASAGQFLQDLTKDRPSQKNADQVCQQVMSAVKAVDLKLSEQIRYLTQVSTGHPHEGSSYPSQKILQTAWHRLEHARSRVSELERMGLTPAQRHALIQQQQQQQQQQQ